MAINVIDEFLKLVSINSPSKKEAELAGYLKNKLKELGAEVYEDSSASRTGSDTGNIIGYYPGNREGAPTVLLCAHMDTIVPTEGMEPIIKEGFIYSDGKTILGADDKAGIAVILAVLDRLNSDRTIPHGPVEIVFTVQEEVGLIGTKNLDYKLKADFGYVLDGDGSVGTIIYATPSHVILDLVVEGKAAHAGVSPELGVNAIVVASKAIADLPSGRIDEETTSNFGIINGGKGRNIVADRVEIKAEVRSRNREKLDSEVNKMINKFEQTTAEYGAKFSYKKELAYEAFNISKEDPVCKHAVKAAEKTGVKANLKPTGGGLDANIFNARGVPCVALGLGGDKPHTNEEYISIEEMEKCVDYLLEILKESASEF